MSTTAPLRLRNYLTKRSKEIHPMEEMSVAEIEIMHNKFHALDTELALIVDLTPDGYGYVRKTFKEAYSIGLKDGKAVKN